MKFVFTSEKDKMFHIFQAKNTGYTSIENAKVYFSQWECYSFSEQELNGLKALENIWTIKEK